MADRSQGDITIHGLIPSPAALYDLATCWELTDANAFEPSDLSQGPEDVAGMFFEAAESRNCLTFTHEQAAGGELEDAREICKKHGVPYQQHAHGCAYYDGTMWVYDGKNEPFSLLADMDGVAYISVPTLLEAMLEGDRTDDPSILSMLVDSSAVPDPSPVSLAFTREQYETYLSENRKQ